MLCGIFFLLGGGNLFSLWGIIIVIFSIIVHDFSFAHNSVMDVLAGYDKKDKFKKHFPLCNGRVDPFTALKITHIGSFLTTIFAILLAYFGSGNSFYAISFYAIFIICGFWYNEWTSKIVIWDFVPISICFASLSVYAYFLVSDEFTLLLILAAIYISLVEWYQVGVSGEIKDFEIVNEVSLLRHLGAKCDRVFNLGIKAFVYALAVKLSGILILGIIVFKYNFTFYGIIVFALMSILIIHFALNLTKIQKRDRNKAICNMACEEIASIFALPLILIPIIDTVQALFLILFSLLYFVFMNKINWNTMVRPKV